MSKSKKFDQKGNFEVFSNDVDLVKSSVQSVAVSIYKNNEGTIFATDSNGNIIQEKLVKRTVYALPRLDKNGVNIAGSMKIYFKDNSTFTNEDNNPEGYWYSILGMSPFAIKNFI